MAGARALWRATGMKTEDFLKPVVAIANSFTQFVPGHVHLHPIGQRVKQVVDAAGGYDVEFNTIAVDVAIAMGHDGMLLHQGQAARRPLRPAHRRTVFGRHQRPLHRPRLARGGPKAAPSDSWRRGT